MGMMLLVEEDRDDLEQDLAQDPAHSRPGY